MLLRCSRSPSKVCNLKPILYDCFVDEKHAVLWLLLTESKDQRLSGLLGVNSEVYGWN